MAKLTAEDRFWAKVDKSGQCWTWTASLDIGGYGKFSVGDGRWERAHRVAYRWLVGPIPDGLQLDHLCRVRKCVNPAHLEPVTPAENIRRGALGVLKTHCPAGHPYDEANTRIVDGNHRQCRTCDRERTRVKNGYQGIVRGGTHCRNGHEYTPENTRLDTKGWRVCRICVRAHMQKWRAKAT